MIKKGKPKTKIYKPKTKKCQVCATLQVQCTGQYRYRQVDGVNDSQRIGHLMTTGRKINADDNVTLEAQRGILEIEAFLADASLVAA